MTLTHTQEGDAYLSISEASELSGLSPATLRRYGDDGTIPEYRTPKNHRRFLESDLAKLGPKQAPRGARGGDAA